MARTFTVIAAALGFLGVALGAFGAHGLKERLSAELMAVYQTGVQYHFVHALALLAVGLWAERAPSSLLHTAGWAFVAGVMLFSGSLYALALTGTRGLGAVTPFGGLAFLVGWACLGLAAWRA